MKTSVLRTLVATSLLMMSARCTLYSDVSVSPLRLRPGDISIYRNVGAAVQQADFIQALALGSVVDARANASSAELAALGRAELAAGFLDDGRRHLRSALALSPVHTEAAQIAWDLSQIEYLDNNYAASLDWAERAVDSGLTIRKWHLELLRALVNEQVYQFSGTRSSRINLGSSAPRVPRISTRVNNVEVSGIVDSGAAMSIVSQTFATKAAVRALGDFDGTFNGLLGEPIPVRFGIIDQVRIGNIEVKGVPVAIMKDDQLKFVTTNREPFNMEFLLGANFLKEFVIELDFPSDRATFSRVAPVPRKLDPQQNMFWVGFRPYVRGTLNKKGWYIFALDTGSEVTFLNDKEVGSTALKNRYAYHSALLQGLGGATKRGLKVEDVSLGVAGWSGDFKTLPLYNSESSTALGIIGENLLSHFKVTLDFRNMKLILDRPLGGNFPHEPVQSVGSSPSP
jgi:hypothetical protein